MGCGSSKAVVRDFRPPVEFFGKYTLAGLLGKGSYGSVYLAHTIETNEEHAVKILDLKSGKRDGKGQATQHRQDFDAERMAWARIGVHPNIVVLRESFVDESFAYLVMERCTVSLLDAWKAEPNLNEYAYARYFMQMARALAHIHSVGVVHRDVKHDNFMLGAPDGRTVKLYDFGLSAVTAGAEGLSGHFGTAPYMAPEMVSKFPETHGPPSDVWSLGVMVYIAFFGGWPYQGKQNTKEEMHAAIRRGTVTPSFAPVRRFLPNRVSDAGIRFVKLLLHRSPLTRPSAASCLQMDYLNSWCYQRGAANRKIARDTSLAPVLKHAVSCRAFNIRRPTVDVRQETELRSLQSAAQARRNSSFADSNGFRQLADAYVRCIWIQRIVFVAKSFLHPKFGMKSQDRTGGDGRQSKPSALVL